MLSIVDLVVPYNGAAVGSDLDSRQGVTIDIVTLYQTPSISEYVHPSLVTVEYSISPGYKRNKHNIGINMQVETETSNFLQNYFFFQNNISWT